MEHEIIYTNNRHGYARIKDGKLVITIPKILRYNKKFKETLIQQGEKLLAKHKKYNHIKTQDKDTVLVFGEEVPKSEFKGDLTKNLKSILLEYIEPIVDEFSQKLGYDYSKISVRKVKSKRGSCSSDQKLMFNLNLLHLSTKYVRYVIIHEVCHLKHKNHSKDFWAEVEGFLPNYREIRREMKKMIVE